MSRYASDTRPHVKKVDAAIAALREARVQGADEMTIARLEKKRDAAKRALFRAAAGGCWEVKERASEARR